MLVVWHHPKIRRLKMSKFLVLVCSAVFCLPLAMGAEKKKVVQTDEERVVTNPAVRTECLPPIITKERIVLRASHSLGYRGRGETFNEVVLVIEDAGGLKRARLVTNENYEVNKAGVRIGEKWRMTEAYVWRYCLGRRGLPSGTVRELLAGREQELLLNPKE